MKMILEYKLVDGKTPPDYIEDGGYWPVGDTLIGYSIDLQKVPAEATQLTEAQLKARVAKLDIKVSEDRDMTVAEKNAQVETELTVRSLR